MARLSKNIVKGFAKALLFLLVSAFLTLMGLYFSWSQVHSPDWKGEAAIVLLLPFAVINRMVHWFSHSEPMSSSTYHLTFFLGCLGQLLYYFAIFTLINRLVWRWRQPLRSSTRRK